MKIIIFFILLIISKNSFSQDCAYNISTDFYFPVTISDSQQTLPYSLVLSRGQTSNGPSCENYRLYFGKGNANSYQRQAFSGSNTINYNLYKEINRSTILKDFSDAGSTEFITGYAPSKLTPYTSTWYVGVPNIYDNFSSSPAGVYTDVIPVNIYHIKNNGSVEFQTARHVTLSFTVPRFVEMSIVDQNQPHDSSSTTYTMDFGEISSNQQLQADLRVVGNVGYSVSLTSANGGVLKNTNPSSSSQISYSIQIGNGSFFSPTNANSPYFLFDTNTPTTIAGNRYPLRVRLATVLADPEDGDYAESITFTIQAY